MHEAKNSVVDGIAVAALLLALSLLATDAVGQEADLPEEATDTTSALEELSSAYSALAEMLGQGSGEAVGRVQGEVENLGDWEYRIVDLSNESIENLESELNALGDERWEVFRIDPVADGVRVYLKRPAASILSRVPLTTLIRMLAGGL